MRFVRLLCITTKPIRDWGGSVTNIRTLEVDDNALCTNAGSHKIYTGGTERLTIDNNGQSTFDRGAPASSNKVIGRFQCESSRKLDLVLTPYSKIIKKN